MAVVGLVGGCTTFDRLGMSQAPCFDAQGHRGARALLPENTLAGFVRAIEVGVTTLEIDLGVTRDRVVVVSHDRRMNPAICLDAEGRELADEGGPFLRDLTWEQVRAFDCGALNPDPERFPEPPRRNLPGTAMPSLRELLDLLASRGDERTRLNLEIKTKPGSGETVSSDVFAALVVDEVRAADVLARTQVQAFDWSVLAHVKRLEPRLRTVALFASADPVWQAGLRIDDHGDVLGLLAAADWIDDFSPHWRLLVPEEDSYLGRPPRDYQRRGYRVVPWTVNDTPTMERLIELGVDGLISDRPDLLVALVADLGDASAGGGSNERCIGPGFARPRG